MTPMRRLLLTIPFIIATPCHAQTQGAPVEAFSFGAPVGTPSNPFMAALSSVVPSAHASTQAAAPVELFSYGRRIGTPDNPININLGNALAPYLTQTQAASTYQTLSGDLSANKLNGGALNALTGSGNAFACINASGQLYRSSTACQ